MCENGPSDRLTDREIWTGYIRVPSHGFCNLGCRLFVQFAQFQEEGPDFFQFVAVILADVNALIVCSPHLCQV